jgi:ABC-type polysaccharide/polyol phosphate transport system ATPase subunit
VFLNGTILGMTRREVAAKLDSIVEFSGIGRFLDTPVKWYSSGMYVRLGFSVAAHLEPEILLVDEVLAVGDAEFQARCLRRMAEHPPADDHPAHRDLGWWSDCAARAAVDCRAAGRRGPA